MPAAHVLQRIERHGVLIDPARLAAQSRQLSERMVALEQEAYAIAEQPFNLGSPKQIGEILFGKLGLPVQKKTASGAPSTDEGRARSAGRRLPAAGAHPRAPQPGQAQGHLHRQAAADGQPGHRARAHQLRAGGGRHRAPGQQRPEPAEHPDPHEGGPARARGLRRAAGACAAQRRLQPDRAAHHGPHQRRPRPAARLRRRHRRAQGDRQRGLQGAGGRGQQRAAALRQGHQLRPDLRHGRLRPGEQPGHRAEGRQGLHRALLRALCRRQALHGADQGQRGRTRLCRDPVRPPHLPARDPRRQRPAPRRRRAPGDQRADAGHRGRPDQAGHDRGAEGRWTTRVARRG